jgi:hypothetical protein
MRNTDNPAVCAAWCRVAERLQPLAAAVTAAGEDSSGTLSLAQCRALVQVADDVEEALNRCTVLPPSSFRLGVPQLVLETVSSSRALMTTGRCSCATGYPKAPHHQHCFTNIVCLCCTCHRCLQRKPQHCHCGVHCAYISCLQPCCCPAGGSSVGHAATEAAATAAAAAAAAARVAPSPGAVH